MSFFKKLFGQKDGDGKSEFDTFIAASMEGVRLQSQSHQSAWGFGKAERWDFSQTGGELVFTFPDKIVRAPAQIIGSFDTRKGTWMWAWANQSIAESLARDSVKVREYGTQHKIERLTTPNWPGEEADGWEMAAVANRICERNSVYRGPAGTSFVFFTFGTVQISKQA